MDAMCSLIQKAKNTVQTMFEQVGVILKDSGTDPKCFQIQFLAYRSYNAPSHLILQASGWSNNSSELRTFLAAVSASYGIADEAACYDT